MPKVVKIQEKKASRHSEIGRRHKKASKTPKIAENGGKSFKYYQNLPAELRMMVVDEMEIIDRCRFSQCSISRSIEARRSKNYIHSLKLCCLRENNPRIEVTYDDDSDSGYFLNFQEDSGKKCMKYTSFQWKELWKSELPSSTDLVEYAAEYFKNLLRDYQNIIRKLKVFNYVENKLSNFDFGFRNLTNLEELEMKIDKSILPVISKLRKPLRTYGEENIRELENYEISKISERIDLPQLKLNYEQFIQLSAPNISINIGGLTEEDIWKVIKIGKTNQPKEKKTGYRWNLEGSIFHVSKLLRFLGAEQGYDPDPENEVRMVIKHRFEKGKEALLVRSDELLSLKA